MDRFNSKLQKEDIYDDYMEPLSNIKGQYVKFDMKLHKYETNSNISTDLFGMYGGAPILWDEENESVYVDNQDTHTLVLGATGSKKTRIVILPTVYLVGWAGESMIISDPKAEIYNRMVGLLEKQGYHISILNFRNPAEGDGWNPLSIPYGFYNNGDIDRACEMVNDIAKNLLAASGESNDPFWQDSAANMFFGLVLTLFKMCVQDQKSEMAVNISNVLKLRRQLFDISDPSDSPIWKYVKDDEVIAPALSGIVMTASDTRAGIISTFDQKVRYFVFQPNLMDMLSNNTIELDYFCEKKSVIFLIMPDEKTTFHTLISLFIKQSYEYLIYKIQETNNSWMKIRLNYILDEFSSLPIIKDFPAMITAARSRNIRFYLVVQSKRQLNRRYKDEAETIQSNCNNWIFLTSREVPLLEEISILCGKIKEGRMPLVSIFSLQHLDKDNGQALMLCGRNRPYYAFLPDIDVYDGKEFSYHKLNKEIVRQQRLDLDGNELASRFIGENSIPIGWEEMIDNNDCIKLLYDVAIQEKRNGFLVTQENAKKNIDRMVDVSIYADKMQKGFSAYTDGKYEKAKEFFLEALNYRPYKDKSCDCENNLGYMLRRHEINELIIDGKYYDVPDILKIGVDERRPFFLVNMGLYSAIMGSYVDLKRGGHYIRQITHEDISEIENWWGEMAQKGELEGYIVLYWLYKYGLITNSEFESEQKIISILKDIFGIEPDIVSMIKEI